MKGNIIISVLPIGNLLSQAQSSYFGFKGGLNRSVLAGTVNISPYYKSGLVLGIYIDRAVTKKFHIQPELVFSRQGARVEYNSSPCSSAVVGETKTSLVYLDLLAKVYVDKVVDPQAVGPGLVLAVNPGDKITMKTYARYLEDPGNTDVVGDLALAVASAFGYDPVDPETQPVYDLFSGAFSGGPLFDGDANGAPKAYLNYIYFDKNFMVEDFGYQQVSTAAQNSWELLDLDIDAKVPGYVYIYVANESTANVNTFFDNIEVILEESLIAGGNDYYPFGMPIAERSYDREDYRFDYQGQFSEKDEETGWNSFQLRMYDARVGRWLAVDPYGQYYSGYLGMGNNPVMGVDPDGGFSEPIFIGEALKEVVITGLKNSDGLLRSAMVSSFIIANEFIRNIGTGKFEQIGSLGGDETHFVHHVYMSRDGGLANVGITVHDGNSPAWDALVNSNPSFSSHNLTGYIYTAADIAVRAKLASIPNNIVSKYLWKIETEGNFIPLTREGFHVDYVRKWGTDKAFIHALEGPYFDVPGGPGDVSLLPKPPRVNIKPRGIIKPVGSIHQPKNPWNAFLKQSKGKYKGPNWIQKARSDYYKSL